MKSIFRKTDLLHFTILSLVIVFVSVFIDSKYHLMVLNVIGLNTIVVVGLNLLVGFAGQISLGHAAFYGFGSYFSGILTVQYGVPPWPAMLVGAMATGLIAYLVGYPALKLRGHYLVMATLGFSMIVYFAMGEFKSYTGGYDGLIGIPSLSLGGIRFDGDRMNFILIWIFVLLSMLLSRNLLHSRVGRALRAIHGSEVAANSLGVDTAGYKVKVFVLSAIFASVSGSLYAHYIGFISPTTYDFNYSIQVVTMVVVGGMGSLWGSMFGAAFLTIVSEALHEAKQFHLIAYGVILCLMLIFLPDGILVSLHKIIQRRRAPHPVARESRLGFSNTSMRPPVEESKTPH